MSILCEKITSPVKAASAAAAAAVLFSCRTVSGENNYLHNLSMNSLCGTLFLIFIISLFISAGIFSYLLMLKKRLKEIENLFQTLFETSPYSISLTRTDNGRYVMANSAFVSFTGFSADEVRGKTAAELGINLIGTDFNALYEKLLINRRVDNEEVIISNKDGVERYGLFSVSFIKLRGEEYVLTITVDITETKNTGGEIPPVAEDGGAWSACRRDCP